MTFMMMALANEPEIQVSISINYFYSLRYVNSFLFVADSKNILVKGILSHKGLSWRLSNVNGFPCSPGIV